MGSTVDFTMGGYSGDEVEELFKLLTQQWLPFWWHFREVLRSSDRASPLWKKSDGTNLTDDDYSELIALSSLHYHVYTEWTAATTFLADMEHALTSTDIHPEARRLVEVRKTFKATYSCLYSSYNSLCNIVYATVKPDKARPVRPLGEVWNRTPTDALKLVKHQGISAIATPLDRVNKGLAIRNHLDHYWMIWLNMSSGRLLIDSNFKKGYVALHPESEVSTTVDAILETQQFIDNCAADFNQVYEELSTSGGYLDKYLAANGWVVDYSGYGPPHNGKRPLP